MERTIGIEPISSAWKAEEQPLSQVRIHIRDGDPVTERCRVCGLPQSVWCPRTGPGSKTCI